MKSYGIFRALGLVALLAGVFAQAAHADADDPALLALGVGYYDIGSGDDTAVDFRLEYRHDQGFWIVGDWIGIKPWVGIEATSDAAVYGVGGLLLDIDLGPRLIATPSAGVGAYADGDGKDLGHTVEFRTQFELAYRFDNRSRLGLAFSHISNAGIGDKNPGVEILNVYYALPLGRLFGE